MFLNISLYILYFQKYWIIAEILHFWYKSNKKFLYLTNVLKKSNKLFLIINPNEFLIFYKPLSCHLLKYVIYYIE